VIGSWRARTWERLEGGSRRPPAGVALGVLVVSVVVVSVIAMCLETLEILASRAQSLFWVVELLVVAFLTVDYAVWLWVAPEREPDGRSTPWRARLRYAVSAAGIIDLVAIAPVYLSLVIPVDPDWLRVVRLLRLLKIARYTPALSLFAAVLRNERRVLLAALWVVLVLLVLDSAIMFVLERAAQPTVFASIPHAMWWAIVTIGTVGYGDMYPVTPLGKVFGGVVMILGIALFAVPTGILVTGFAAEVRKRDFVVTWQTVARVPFFATLDATRIAEIARLLRREVVPAKFAVVRRGEPADAMFFIMAGEVEVDVEAHPIRLGPGQYFGEIALLHDTVRTATVTAISECEMLSLGVADFRQLLESNPSLRAAISRVAEQRLHGSHARDVTAPPAPG
jgi:voltage-gated potassium channel